MKLIIDNNDGQGVKDYTSYLDAEDLPKVSRKLNRAIRMTTSLVAANASFVPPALGARVTLQRGDGYKLFTGYVTAAPQQELLGLAQSGRAWRYAVQATDDSWLLDRNMLAIRPPFTRRTAGDALKTITNDVLPGALDTSGVQDVGYVEQYHTSAQKSWSAHAQELATMMRSCYSVQDGKVSFQPVGQAGLTIDEANARFLPGELSVTQPDSLLNDVTVVGELEPKLYVRDYFLGDGLTLNFGMSSTPYQGESYTLFQEDYLGPALSPTLWSLNDPNGAVWIGGGALHLNGPATLKFVEQVELAGGMRVQHGQVTLGAASRGTIGGLYNGNVSDGNCLAGFRLTPSGGNTTIQALVNGSPVGNVITSKPGHVYAFATHLVGNEAHRVQQAYYSSQHGAGHQRGGDTLGAAVRVVLSVHDVDPNDPGTFGAPATVLYDDVQWSTPPFATYAVADGTDLHLDLAFTRVSLQAAVEVRSMPPGQSFHTRLSGGLADGGECYVSSAGNLRFYPPYPPVPYEQIIVSYRSSSRAMARVQDTNSIAAHRKGADNGLRMCVKGLGLPGAGTSVDCENAALAVLDDSTQQSFVGSYEAVSDLLPANDVTPGTSVQVNAPSWHAQFSALVREVEIEVLGADEDRSHYSIKFANEAADPVAFKFDSATLEQPLTTVFTISTPSGSQYLPSLSLAGITASIATEVTIDAGWAPPNGGGIEVRRSDGGWGPANSGNLVGRYTSRTFTVPRLSRVQDYYLRQYDASSPTKYSRYSTLLHLDYPYQ